MLSGLRLIFIFSLLVLLGFCMVLSWTTREAMVHLPFLRREANAPGFSAIQNAPVDLRPWQTAQRVAALAVTAEEVEYGREAERLADHAVDQAFASALRQASAQQHPLTQEALTLVRRVAELQQIVKEDQAHLQSLTEAASSTGKRAAPVSLGDDLDVAKAQLGLDSDELVDAQRDLARAVGDERATIQQELAAHESAMRNYDAQARNGGQLAVVSAQQYGTLARLLKAWLDQRSRYDLIQQAMQQAEADAVALTAQHNLVENQANTAGSPSTADLPLSPADKASSQGPDKASRLATLAAKSAHQQLLSIYDDRIQTQRQLAVVYGKWSAQLLLQRRIVLHVLLQLFALIAFILICVILIDALVRHLLDHPGLDRRRTHTLRILFQLGIQFVGLLLVLLVIFGAPYQMPTIVGLTTAGLTVVLQDFILAFFGWFVLMGKNGIRLGDWVEINGVGGEVVDIGLFRTALLETGNWTDKAHPTGRRVTFINSFAIKGQFFNFSTTGQWMWDEIMFSIPASENTYATIELIYQAVLKETEKEARFAEEEWRRVTQKSDMSRFTAEPAVDMRPGAVGIDIVLRYVTRASNRFEMRNRLYQRVIDLLHKTLTPRPDIQQPRSA